MLNTTFVFQFRNSEGRLDAPFVPVVFGGAATPEHEERLRAVFEGGVVFNGAALGLPRSLASPRGEFVGLEATADLPTEQRTIEQFVVGAERWAWIESRIFSRGCDPDSLGRD